MEDVADCHYYNEGTYETMTDVDNHNEVCNISFIIYKIQNNSMVNADFFVEAGNSINSLLHNPDFSTTLKYRAFENIVGKGENAGNQHFLLFPQCFLPFPKKI